MNEDMITTKQRITKLLQNKISLLLFTILITDISIFLDLPFLRQLLAALLLTTFPGIIVLANFKLKLKLYEKIILIVGTSLSIVTIYGLFLNFILPVINCDRPLSTLPLLVSFNTLLVVLIIVTYLRNQSSLNTKIKLSNQFSNIKTLDKFIIIVSIHLFLLTLLGIERLNITGDNTILLLSYILILVYVAGIAMLNEKISSKVYPVVIFIIGLSLVLVLPLRSDHIIGIDSHYEYYLFQLTYSTGYWQILNKTSVDTCLSISLLPTVYRSLMNVKSECLFRFFYPIVASLIPLIVYSITSRYVNNFYAFLSSLLLVSHYLFLYAEAYARQILATFFFALAIMTLFSGSIPTLSRRLLFVIFSVSCILSHYSTSYIFLAMLISTWAISQILLEYKHHIEPKSYLVRYISLFHIIIFFLMLFLWYSLIFVSPFAAGIRTLYAAFINLNKLFVLELKDRGTSEMLGWSMLSTTIPRRIELMSVWLIVIFTIIGVLSVLFETLRGSKTIKNVKDGKIYLSLQANAEFLATALSCIIILLCSVLLPFVTKVYSVKRLSFQLYIILSQFFVIGNIRLFKLLKFKKRIWVPILLTLFLFYLSTTGIVYQVFDIPYKITLNNKGFEYRYLYIHDQESCSAKWLKKYKKDDARIYTDFGGDDVLLSQAGISSISYYDSKNNWQGYVYLRYYNVVYGKLLSNGYIERSMSEFQEKFQEKNKIYDNGGSEIWI